MREESNEFIENQPSTKRSLSIVLEKLSGVAFFLSLFITFSIVLLRLTNMTELSFYLAGITFFIGCIVVLFLLNIWITQQDYEPLGKFAIGITVNVVLLMIPIFVLLFTLSLSEGISISKLVILLPLFLAQIFFMLFACFIIPGIVAEVQVIDRRWVYLIIAYYLSLWTSEAFVIMQLNWYISVMPVVLILIIHWLMAVPGCCDKTNKLLSFWMCTTIMILIYSVLAIPLTLYGKMTIIYTLLPITTYTGLLALVVMFS